MNEKVVLLKLIKGEKVEMQDIYDDLTLICEDVHAYCNYECPVYSLNYGKVPWNKDLRNCSCFKDGKKMYDFIKERI